MPPPDSDSASASKLAFFVILAIFLACFAGFFSWSVIQRRAAQEHAEARRAYAEAIERESRERAEAARAMSERERERDAESAAPRRADPAAPQAPRRPTSRELGSGDLQVTLLDGTVVLQPRQDLAKFALFAEGEKNVLGLPSGVLPDGRWIYENMPVTVEQNGKRVEILTRAVVAPVKGEVAEGEDAPVKRN